MGTVAIVTLGCARNEVDTDQIAALLTGRGFHVVADPDGADAVIVNTCTFIEAATQESVDTVLEACALKESGARAVVVAGCMAQRYGDELAQALFEADAVIGFADYRGLPDLLADLLGDGRMERAPRLLPLAPPPTSADDLERIPPSGPRFPLRTVPARPWAYLKIASGCDRACTFCAIPSWRGGFRSRPPEEIVAEATWLAERGAREIVLVSENTTSWGKDLPGGRDLQARLLEELARVDGVARIRLAYLQPDELRPELIEAMVGIDEVVPYFDLSLQHASAPVLRRMARSGDRGRFLALVEAIRALEPDAVFRSNFIVGFPGETDRDLEELAAFLEVARLDWVGLFTFSPQEGTAAAGLDDPVDAGIARDRLRRLADLQELIAEDAARRFVGRRLEVIVEECDEDGSVGRSFREGPETDGEIRLVSETPGGHRTDLTLPPGRTVTATVVDTDGVDLVAAPEELPAAMSATAAGSRIA